jgi:predicted nucleic acid-binding protein
MRCRFLIPKIILPEITCHLVQRGNTRTVIKAWKALFGGKFTLLDVTPADYTRAIEILDKYHDTRIDFVDACLMALTDRLKTRLVLTFDRLDFGLYRAPDGKSLDLLP